MEHYEIYSSRSGLSETAISIPRGHTKFKRERSDFTNESKISSAKLPRQSVINNEESVMHQTDTNAMSVLPRLLRTMANGTSRETSSIMMSTAASGHLLNEIAANASNGLLNVNPAVAAAMANDTDSTSSSSSFHSTPSSVSNSSIISFLTPGQLGPVAAMAAAAAALNVPNSTSSIPESPESSGLVTLATASTMFEKEWLARSGFSGENGTNGHSFDVAVSNAPTAQAQGDVITLTVEHGEGDQHGDGSSPLLFRTITATSPHSQVNGSTPVTRAMLNVQSLAAFLRETQKQHSASPAQLELPVSSSTVSVSAADNSLVNSCSEDNRMPTPVHQVTSDSSILSLSVQTTAPSCNPESGQPSMSLEVENCDPGALQQTAFFSLQPAPGSLLSSSDLQQLMASGEFMTSAARKTLLGQSPDGTTRQLYLLVPSDCPVIMSRSNQASSNMPPSPVLNSVPNNAPILEAISPGVEQDENCSQLPPAISSAMSPQPVNVALPQIASAVLAPISSASTALSTLIAGFEVRNQTGQQARYTSSSEALSSSTSSWSCANATTAMTTDSSSVRLPISLPGVSLSDHNILTADRSAYHNLQNNNISTLLGAVKSDPDMYTPNGHPYTSLVEDVNRFRPYSTYQQTSDAHDLPVGASRNSTMSTSAGGTATFFQSDLPVSILLPQSGLNSAIARSSSGVNSTMNGSSTAPGNGNGDLSIGTHLISASPAQARVNTSFSSGVLPSSIVSGTSLLPTNPKVVNASLEECRRSINTSLLTPGSNGRNDAASTTYLEHLNPDSKDIRRRVSHNEVERRRRDRINTWISELYKLLPPDEQAKSQYQSKGIVLKRVCEYFQNVDSMLKAANAAVEQTRVENGLLRQRNRELQQENQLLSASLHLGAAAAAAHLKNRQPRTNAVQLNSDELNGSAESSSHMKESSEPMDYPAGVTVFAVNSNTDYSRATDFSQANSTCMIPTQSISSTSFTAMSNPCSSSSNSNTFAVHGGSLPATVAAPASTMISPVIRPLTLPSLDLVANHTTDTHPE